MKPLIGIAAYYGATSLGARRLELKTAYAEAVRMAGGVPIGLVDTVDPQDYADRIDGLLITGGGDLDATLWGEPLHPKAEDLDPARFAFETQLLDRMGDRPVLGICYGCQFLAVAAGGSLRQHLPDDLGHDRHASGEWQSFRVAPESRMASIVGAVARGRSWHHQAIAQPGSKYRAVAWADDGVIEAIESTNGAFRLGVQWHPEASLDEATSRSLFAAFIAAAGGRP